MISDEELQFLRDVELNDTVRILGAENDFVMVRFALHRHTLMRLMVLGTIHNVVFTDVLREIIESGLEEVKL